MKLVKFCIHSCSECPHLQYKFEELENKYIYYCKFMYKYLENNIDIRYSVADNCLLEDC